MMKVPSTCEHNICRGPAVYVATSNIIGYRRRRRKLQPLARRTDSSFSMPKFYHTDFQAAHGRRNMTRAPDLFILQRLQLLASPRAAPIRRILNLSANCTNIRKVADCPSQSRTIPFKTRSTFTHSGRKSETTTVES